METESIDIEEIENLISVAMPVYNGEKYLAIAIESILAQTYRNFELIIINDGSTDDSLNVIQFYQRQDQRIRVVTRENRNLVTTLNEIIDMARGKWIARMDQDDIALHQRFERQLSWIQQTNSDICGSWVQLFGSTDRRVLKHAQDDSAIKMEMLFSSPFAHPSVLMKTKLIRELRYDIKWEMCEDYDLWERAARSGWRMTNIQEILLLYRQHPLQITSNTVLKNHSLAQKIRRRYWEYVSFRMNINKSWIDDVISIRDSKLSEIDMGNVDSAFAILLEASSGEAKRIIFQNITRLYYLLAGRHPDAHRRWSHLNKLYGNRRDFHIKVKIWLLSRFHLNPNSAYFGFVKRIYIYLTG
jgi:glycosyltransferase involved in cell wall biosynthesis